MTISAFGNFDTIRIRPIEDVPIIDVPVGERCGFCGEAIEAADCGYSIPSEHGLMPHHLPCFIRQIAGSVGHQKGRCPCRGGTEEDPPHLTRRQAAQAAFELFCQSQLRVGDLVLAEGYLGLIEGFEEAGVQVMLGNGLRQTLSPSSLVAVPFVADGIATANFAEVRFMDLLRLNKEKHGQE